MKINSSPGRAAVLVLATTVTLPASTAFAFNSIQPKAGTLRQRPSPLFRLLSNSNQHNINDKDTSMMLARSNNQDDVNDDNDTGLMSMKEDDEAAANSPSPSLATWAMLGLPFLSGVSPLLLQTARSLPANSSEQLVVVTALFVGNRAYLYAMAASIVALAALRGAQDEVGLGKRITDLTEELLYRPDLAATKEDDNSITTEDSSGDSLAITQPPTKTETPKMIQELRQSGLEESLDGVSSETQALVLPLLVSFLLAASIFFLPFFNGGVPEVASVQTPGILQDLLKEYLPLLSQIWNAGILAAFSKAELRRLGSELRVQSPAALEWGLAVSITAVACFTPLWPAQNFVNMALAVLVSRMIQLDRFSAVVGALSLLTLYDVTSVFLIPAAGAAEVAMQSSDAALSSSDLLLSGAGDSAMGSVAIQKLTSGTFQPGLLVTKIDKNNLGGALGLGDAVFPSILATFVRRFDLSQADDNRLSLFAVAMGGYLLGCTACEFAPMISTSGLPALVFIIPFMLGSVFTAATVTGELEQLWKYDPKAQ